MSHMDIVDLRSLMTVVSFLTFVGIVVWAYGKGRRQRFDEAALLPFTEDEVGRVPVGGTARVKGQGEAS